MPWCCAKPPQGDAEGGTPPDCHIKDAHGGQEKTQKAKTGDIAATSALASLQLPRLLGDSELNTSSGWKRKATACLT